MSKSTRGASTTVSSSATPLQIIETLGTYDMVILCDVVEHLDQTDGWALLDKAVDHCRAYVILGIPLGRGWTQPEVYGNPHEAHRSFWSAEDFHALAEKRAYFNFPNIGDYGCFLIHKDRYLSQRTCDKADRLFAGGRHEEAILGLKRLLSGSTRDLRAEYLLVDLLLKSRRIGEATERLERIRACFPEDRLAEKYIHRLRGLGGC